MNFTFYILPALIFCLFTYAYFKKVNAYESFIRGCIEGIKYVYEILPYMLSMILATTVFRASGFLESLTKLFKLSTFINIDLVNLMVFKPMSGMASTVILNDIFAKYGPDSMIGTLASVIAGSTDTTLYIITVYFGAVGIQKIRHTVKAGLLIDLLSFIISFMIVFWLF